MSNPNLQKPTSNPYDLRGSGGNQGKQSSPTFSSNQGEYSIPQHYAAPYGNLTGNPRNHYPPSPEIQGLTHGAWSFVLFGASILLGLLTFFIPFSPLLALGSNIAGMVIGSKGWKNYREPLARGGFWVNLGSILLGIILSVLLVMFFIGLAVALS